MQLPVELIFEHEVWAYDIDIGMIEQFFVSPFMNGGARLLYHHKT
jgi:hypothetical protein